MINRPKGFFDMGAESGEDAVLSKAAVQSRLDKIEDQILQIKSSPSPDQIKLALLNKDAAWRLLELEEYIASWDRARTQFDILFQAQQWEDTIELCDILFQCNQPESLTALGQGVWLSVTFPIDPTFTIAMLQHVIDETSDDADGAAVAAATAVYVYDLRKDLAKNSDSYVDAMQMLTTVGRRHGNAHDQLAFDQWIKKMELDIPEKFLTRLRNVIDVLVQDQWWFDRDKVQATLPSDDQS